MTKNEYLDKVQWLNDRTKEYEIGCPTVSDKTWDDVYFEIQKYEFSYPKDISPWSPTQVVHFEEVSELKKVKHNHLMLSLNKTKDIEEVKSFIGDKDYIVMAKMDGLTCSLHYEGGKLVSAETRGDGEIGEDITHNAMVIPSIPKRIKYKEPLTIDGEIICTYADFHNWCHDYKNPRNFAAGSIRLLDSKECKERDLTFVAWDVINKLYSEYGYPIALSAKLRDLEKLGFIIVPYYRDQQKTYNSPFHVIEEQIEQIKEDSINYPIDGVVFKYNDINEYEAAGRTDHHFKGGLAYKFYDETYETRLCDIEWSISRTGQISPIAVFENINIDGTDISKASLSNLSIMKQTLGEHPFVGQELRVSKRNQIIPKIERAKDENGEWIN